MCCYEALALRSVCPAVGGLYRRDGCAWQRNAHRCTHPRRCGDRGNGRGRGDQYVTVNVETPRNLTKEQKEALRSFSDMLGESNYEKRKSFFKKK